MFVWFYTVSGTGIINNEYLRNNAGDFSFWTCPRGTVLKFYEVLEVLQSVGSFTDFLDPSTWGLEFLQDENEMCVSHLKKKYMICRDYRLSTG
jgi:hypothetical protein